VIIGSPHGGGRQAEQDVGDDEYRPDHPRHEQDHARDRELVRNLQTVLSSLLTPQDPVMNRRCYEQGRRNRCAHERPEKDRLLQRDHALEPL
jgi:hypothetical protein